MSVLYVDGNDSEFEISIQMKYMELNFKQKQELEFDEVRSINVQFKIDDQSSAIEAKETKGIRFFWENNMIKAKSICKDNLIDEVELLGVLTNFFIRQECSDDFNHLQIKYSNNLIVQLAVHLCLELIIRCRRSEYTDKEDNSEGNIEWQDEESQDEYTHKGKAQFKEEDLTTPQVAEPVPLTAIDCILDKLGCFQCDWINRVIS